MVKRRKPVSSLHKSWALSPYFPSLSTTYLNASQEWDEVWNQLRMHPEDARPGMFACLLWMCKKLQECNNNWCNIKKIKRYQMALNRCQSSKKNNDEDNPDIICKPAKCNNYTPRASMFHNFHNNRATNRRLPTCKTMMPNKTRHAEKVLKLLLSSFVIWKNSILIIGSTTL